MIWGLVWLQQIFLVGDAGALTAKQVAWYERFWALHAQPGDILIWLGDNVYPRGYDTTSARARRRWQRVVQVSQAFPGEVWMTPGNHDWKAGLVGLQRQAADIPHYPKPGYVGPETLQRRLGTFFFLDSEAYIRRGGWDFDWARWDSFWEAAASQPARYVVLHHPPRTAGAHGGHFPLVAHLFPLRTLNPYLYIPLPGLGSLYIGLRRLRRHPTDLGYPPYRRFADSLLQRLHRSSGRALVVAGHDHNLQAHRLGPQKWVIVSGSGCKAEPLRRKKAFWGRAVVGLWKITPTTLEAYALKHPHQPIWKFAENVLP
ncbi:MAG: metallophosphoesterase [Bacteroidia bacterium]|nr:metallophosphoesterase [Bacteroidia bacterium]MDW8089284.1 metallophosphoesterase [Bacteroidia bacterium]